MPRLLAIGDIHGQAAALDRLLDIVRPTPEDRLILLGDYVNGGPDSALVLDHVAHLIASHNAVALRGNHDLVFEQYLLGSTRADLARPLLGPETPTSYARVGVPPTRDAILARHAATLAALKDWHEEPEAIFVHASIDPALPMHLQPRETLLWLKLEGKLPQHISGKPVICGHTRQRDGKPRRFGSAICIDTNAKGGEWLTCLDVLEGRCIQTRPDGRTRDAAIARA